MNITGHRAEVRFASFLSGGFTTMAVINPPEKKLQNPPLCIGTKAMEIVCVKQTNRNTKIGNL